mmetsp:Transcript_78261/g.135785  ORF Transcript_78261/g.135785 Transcript_78261/m.135785 type:complete len:383 (-) Transcript_78261:56-1204(-)
MLKGAGSNQGYRFTVGTRVICRTGPSEWSAGVIVALTYREPSWPPGKTVPYQVQLFDGRLIFVPADVEQLCRKLVPPWWVNAIKKSASLYAEYNPKADTLMKEAEGKNVNEKDHEGNTALMEAVRKCWLNGVAALIQMKADVEVIAQDSKRAIHLAAQATQNVEASDMLKLLVDAGADLNCQDQDPDYDPEFSSTTFGDRLEHRTPLHYLCLEGDAAAAKLLLQAKAEIDIQDAQWKTPLHLAIDAEQMDCIDLLLGSGANANLGNQSAGMDNSPLMGAASAGNVELVQKLIAAKADINKKGKQGMSALHHAARSRRSQVAEVLLAARADMNDESKVGTALQLARKNGGADLLKVFGVDEAPATVGTISSLDAAQRAALFLE